MIRQASHEEMAVLSEVMNNSLMIDGRQLPPMPVDEAKDSVASILGSSPELIDYDDYFVGESEDGEFYTSALGMMNSVMSHLVPGAMIGQGPDGALTFFIDEERFFETISRMREGYGLVVNITIF